MKIFKFFVYIALLIFLCAFAAKFFNKLDAKDESYNDFFYNLNYLTVKYNIKRHIIAGGSSVLLNDGDFIALHKNSTKNFEYIKKYLAKGPSDSAKEILILSSQCLSIEEYVSLGKLILSLDRIDLSIMYLVPGPEYGFILDKNYESDIVIDMLKSYQLAHPDLKESIDLILVGVTIRRYREYIEYGADKLPFLDCPIKELRS